MGRARGFTLIELMFTVAIVGILSTVALPAYQDQIRKARRVDGESLLLDIAQEQERYHTNNYSYTTLPAELGYTDAWFWVISDEEHYMALIVPSAGCNIAACFRILGTPMTGSQSQDGALLLRSNGRKQRMVDGAWKEGWD